MPLYLVSFIHIRHRTRFEVSIGAPDMTAAQTQGWAVRLRSEQCGWIMRRWRHGGRVWVAVRRKASELWLIPGDRAVQLKAEGLRAVPSEMWSGGPGAWDWARIAHLLAPARI